jgi:hypothetical protein
MKMKIKIKNSEVRELLNIITSCWSKSTQPQEEWKRAFYKIYNEEKGNIVRDLKLIDFISNLISEIREEEYQRRRKEKIKVCEAGKESCEFTMKQREAEIRKEERERIVKDLDATMQKQYKLTKPDLWLIEWMQKFYE